MMSRSTNPKWQTRTKDCERYKRLLENKELPRFPATAFEAEDFSAQQAVLSHSFAYPTVVQGLSDAFGLRVPDWDVSLAEVANRLGDRPIRLMDVAEQREIGGFTIAQYAQYIEENRIRQAQGEAGLKILNLISLEFSDTPLSESVRSPAFVRDLDWERLAETQLSLTHTQAHTDTEAEQSFFPSSKVQKYCLIGMAGSYTDFHVDFGGTSVWYHVVRGAKRFYLIPPTETNLQRYQEWNRSQKQQSTFLGDLVGKRECFSLDLHEGETLLLPSAWIHAVYTPEDSLVFGGNFLHSLAIHRQLQCFAIEAELKIARIFRYPRFEQLHWKIICLAFHSFSLGEGERQSVIVNNEKNKELNSAWKMFEFLLTKRAVLSQLREAIDHCIAWQLQPVSLQSSKTEAEQTQAMQEEIKSFCEQSTGYAPQEVAQKLAQAVSERLRKKSGDDDEEEEDVPEVDDTYWKCLLSSSAKNEPIKNEKKDDDTTNKSDQEEKEEEEEIPEEGEEERKYRLHIEQSMRSSRSQRSNKQKRTKATADDDDDYKLEFVHVQSTRSGRTSKRVRKELLEELVDEDEHEEEEAEDEDLRDDYFDEDDYEEEDEDHVEDEYVPAKRSTKRASASNSRGSARSAPKKTSSETQPKNPARAPAVKASPAPAAPAPAPKRAQPSKRDKLKALLGKKK